MKNILSTTLLAGACVLLLGSCDKDLTQHGKAPENIGSIVLDRTRIGAGQPIVANCDLPTGGENIATTEYNWKFDNGLAYQGTQQGGKSSIPFTAPTIPGEYSVTFTVRYTFTGPDKDGNIYKDVASTKTYTVVACDALNSFWGDDLTETLLNRPSLQKYQENIYSGSFPDPFSGSSINPPLIATLYYFTDGKLSRIAENETFENSSAAAFTSKYLLVRLHINKLLGVNPVREVVTWTETGQTEAFDPNGDDAYRARIGQGIMEHKAEVVSVFQGGKTDMRLEVYSASGKVNYMRTYQKAGTMP